MYPQDPLGSEETPGSGYLHHLRRFRVSSSKTTPSESPKKSSGSSGGFPAGVNLRASAITLVRPFRTETARAKGKVKDSAIHYHRPRHRGRSIPYLTQLQRLAPCYFWDDQIAADADMQLISGNLNDQARGLQNV